LATCGFVSAIGSMIGLTASGDGLGIWEMFLQDVQIAKVVEKRGISHKTFNDKFLPIGLTLYPESSGTIG